MLQGMKLLIRALPICLLVLVWAGTGICGPSTELLDMRLGVHDEASRAVLTCRGPRPQALGPLSNATYRISFHSLSLPQNWEPARIPQSSFFSHIEYSEDESAQTIGIYISREDLWVEEVVLKKDDRPGEYQLVLDFWPLDPQKAVKRQQTNISPQIPSVENTLEEPAVISALPQGKRMPVRTDVVLQAGREPKGETVAETSKARVTGFRVGEHPGYTRVVVEARGLKPAAIPDVVNGSLCIRYEHLELQVPKEIMRKKVRGLLQGVRVESDCIYLDVQPGTQTKQSVILDSNPPRPGTYRLVLDLESPNGSIGAGNKDKSISR